jgi:hypothetical protein
MPARRSVASRNARIASSSSVIRTSGRSPTSGTVRGWSAPWRGIISDPHGAKSIPIEVRGAAAAAPPGRAAPCLRPSCRRTRPVISRVVPTRPGRSARVRPPGQEEQVPVPAEEQDADSRVLVEEALDLLDGWCRMRPSTDRGEREFRVAGRGGRTSSPDHWATRSSWAIISMLGFRPRAWTSRTGTGRATLIRSVRSPSVRHTHAALTTCGDTLPGRRSRARASRRCEFPSRRWSVPCLGSTPGHLLGDDLAQLGTRET